MKQQLLSLFFIGLFTSITSHFYAQSYTISGYIEDAETGEKLIGANVFDTESQNGAVTNTYGFYSLTLAADSVFLMVTYIGYQPKYFRLALKDDMPLEVKLSSSLVLEEVEVVAEKQKRIEKETQMSRIEVPIEQIKKIPAFMGEVDILKALQLLPGVQSGSEGFTGLYVRGGSPDQNLMLLDGVPIYYASHILGIFSVFNADAIKNVSLTKGGFPARYGGRLSSILEINMKEGNLNEFHAEGSVGLLSSKLTLEGPIQKGKTSFLISGRRTYIDLMTKPFIKSAAKRDDIDLKTKFHFYDLNAKIQHKINDKHRLYLSAYSGADVFKVDITEEDFDEKDRVVSGVDWGNLIGGLRWNYQISNKLFCNTSLTFTDYDITFLAEAESEYANDDDRELFSAKYFSGIRDWSIKTDFDYIPLPDHYLRFGIGAIDHTYKPGALSLKYDDTDSQLDTLLGSKNLQASEFYAYAEDDMELFGNLKANIGLHASAFHVEGKWYASLQPRLGLRYLLPKGIAVKASFSTMTQYINLLTSEALSAPTDLWLPSTERIKPQQSWQSAFGVASTFWDQFELSLEGYYKEMNNVISFKEGGSFLSGIQGDDWQDNVTQGDGKSYGLEFFLQKKKGKTTGWLGYTLSWNKRQFDEINSGREFPYRYDRRHDISLVLSHQLTDNISVSGAWVYGTGNAISLPTYRYEVNTETEYGGYSREVEVLGDKNAYRMSSYHRLDFSIEFLKRRKKFERKWIISVYNTYNHKNPYFIYLDEDYVDDPTTGDYYRVKKFKEVSLLPIIPSIAYSFKF